MDQDVAEISKDEARERHLVQTINLWECFRRGGGRGFYWVVQRDLEE